MLAARRGETDRAVRRLADAEAQPVDGWHQAVHDVRSPMSTSRSATGTKRLARLNEAGSRATRRRCCGRRGSRCRASPQRSNRRSIDRARREPVDVLDVSRLQARIDAVRSLAADSGHSPRRDTSAHLAHAAASLTRLTVSDADAGPRPRRWTDLGDRWATATALVREAEAAALAGAADRATTSLRQAHQIASDLVPTDTGRDRRHLPSDSDQRRRPTRLVVDESSAHSLGLTSREAEVLVLVAAGRTNRQIGTELFVSDKTASVHVSNILRKLGVNSRVDAAAVAQRLGIA